ncbi:FAD dependent oxidoreductase [Necator americanus]|uniref:L-2-hydroxyglutarate dehydrogenase, mitochondrial n=1 Tax=Necator americanus TaxID=51031 RepID=W2SWL0_NECAM|nr:FAD dependent oxidoreductase [Necator americanus]ETN74015.1 FAD dependent oxidoreductase [Necator americanus]
MEYPHFKICMVEKENRLGKFSYHIIDEVCNNSKIIGLFPLNSLLTKLQRWYITVSKLTSVNIVAPHQSGNNSGVVHAGIYYKPGSLKAKLCVEAPHQSGNNSGVVHAGIYYKPGSLKAKLCVEGMDLAYKFFEENNFPHKKIGKLIVAVEPEEIPRLDDLFERATKNGCKDIKMINGSEIKEYEPHCRGLKALWSPHTGIVDWGEVSKAFAADFEKKGGTVYINYPVKDISQSSNPMFPITVRSDWRSSVLLTKYLVSCAGLHSDRVAQLSGCAPSPKIVPFRGEYLLLKPDKRKLVRTNVYPVPDPRFPFLGVHLTPRMNGDIWLGPNAVLAYKREGYSYFSISPTDLFESLTFSGTRKLVGKYFTFGMKELYRGIFISAQVKQLQRFIPELRRSDVMRGPSGVRAQAMDAEGNLVDDFVFDSGTGPLSKRVLHIRNAPSPGATSSLAIAKMIAKEVKSRFSL